MFPLARQEFVMFPNGKPFQVKTAEDLENAKRKQQENPSEAIVTCLNFLIFNVPSSEIEQVCEAFPHLLSLFLFSLGDVVQWLPHLSKFGSLRHLHIFNAPIRDSDLHHFTKIRTLKQLRLDLSQVTDDGLAQLTALKDLEMLGLDQTQISDEGLSVLAKFEKLMGVSLNLTKVTDAGLLHLVNHRSINPSLCAFHDTAITSEGFDAFTKQLQCNRSAQQQQQQQQPQQQQQQQNQQVIVAHSPTAAETRIELLERENAQLKLELQELRKRFRVDDDEEEVVSAVDGDEMNDE